MVVQYEAFDIGVLIRALPLVRLKGVNVIGNRSICGKQHLDMPNMSF